MARTRARTHPTLFDSWRVSRRLGYDVRELDDRDDATVSVRAGLIAKEHWDTHMMIIDSHLDLSWNALNWKRDLTQTIGEIRRSEEGMNDRKRGHNTVSFPELQKAGVAVCLATVLARCSRP